MRPLLLLLVTTATLAACGSTTSVSPATDASTDGSSASDGSVDGIAPGDGGCITPTVGEACTSGEHACQPIDPCCGAGYEWVCTSGTWQQAQLGCACQIEDAGGGDTSVVGDAGPFACGNTKTCSAGTYCTDQPPGIPGPDGSTLPDSFECVTIPTTCASTPTCGCIEGTLGSQDTCSTQNTGVTCTADVEGHVTIHCMGI